MTQQEADRVFFRELKAKIENARANGLRGDIIASDLRSIASDVSKQWHAEGVCRNAERIAQMNAQATAQTGD
jgi:hypothetical protein